MAAVGNQNVLVRLKEIRNSLTPVSKRLADYILKNAAEIPNLSIKSLAQKSHTSDAAVMRFCKSIGFNGYRNLIVSISTALGAMDESRANHQFRDINPGDDLRSIVENISNANWESIINTLSMLDIKQLEKAVALLCAAERVAFCGLGASGLVAMDAQQKFMRINKISAALTDGHSQLTGAVLLGEKDAAVLLSNSGETLDILDAVHELKKASVPIVAITRYGKSSLASCADVVLPISTPELKIRSAAMGSRIAMLNLIDILYAGVVSRDYANVQEYLLRTGQALTVKRR